MSTDYYTCLIFGIQVPINLVIKNDEITRITKQCHHDTADCDMFCKECGGRLKSKSYTRTCLLPITGDQYDCNIYAEKPQLDDKWFVIVPFNESDHVWIAMFLHTHHFRTYDPKLIMKNMDHMDVDGFRTAMQHYGLWSKESELGLWVVPEIN